MMTIKKQKMIIKKQFEKGIIDGETFHLFMKNMGIGYSGASCHITNNDAGFYDTTEINEWYKEVWTICMQQESKIYMQVPQVSHRKRLHILWLTKYCTKDGAHLYSLTFKLLQGRKIVSWPPL